ncbi:vacuolar protein sorting-associated protein 9A-like [Hordeum vulgare]|nr:vacuolar protein sorting-associated protein 9A-like [Hordeum vulgare]
MTWQTDPHPTPTTDPSLAHRSASSLRGQPNPSLSQSPSPRTPPPFQIRAATFLPDPRRHELAAVAALSWVADAARWAEDTRPAAAPPLPAPGRAAGIAAASFEDRSPIQIHHTHIPPLAAGLHHPSVSPLPIQQPLSPLPIQIQTLAQSHSQPRGPDPNPSLSPDPQPRRTSAARSTCGPRRTSAATRPCPPSPSCCAPPAPASAQGQQSFLAALSLEDPSAEADGARVQAFFAEMEAAIRGHPLWADATHQEINHALEGLEKYIMTKLFDRTFASSPEDAAADAEVSDKIGLLQRFVRPHHLDIPKLLNNEASWLNQGPSSDLSVDPDRILLEVFKDADDDAGHRLNNDITAPFLRLVNAVGHDVVPRHEALQMAARMGLDLVEEIKDMKVKADAITRLMERGYKVKCMAMPAGNEAEDLGGPLSRLLGLVRTPFYTMEHLKRIAEEMQKQVAVAGAIQPKEENDLEFGCIM